MQKRKKLIIGIGIVIIVIIAIVGIVWLLKSNQQNNGEEGVNEEITEDFVRTLDNGIKLNVSQMLNEDKKFEEFTLSDIQLTSQNAQTQLLATVTNDSEQATELTQVQVVLYDINGNEIVTLDGIIGPLQPGENTQLNVSSSLDYANAYNFELRKK